MGRETCLDISFTQFEIKVCFPTKIPLVLSQRIQLIQFFAQICRVNCHVTCLDATHSDAPRVRCVSGELNDAGPQRRTHPA